MRRILVECGYIWRDLDTPEFKQLYIFPAYVGKRGTCDHDQAAWQSLPLCFDYAILLRLYREVE